MDCGIQPAVAFTSSYSDPEIDRGRMARLEPSLSRHSHFFGSNGCRLSAPIILLNAANPAVTLVNGSSTENIDGVSVGGAESETGEEGASEVGEGAEKASNIRYENRDSLAHDLQFLANMPELCDVTFLVGDNRQPICGVKAIMAARSRVFRRLLFGELGHKKPTKKKSSLANPPDGYVEKLDIRGQPMIVVTDFEPQVFKLLVDYVHTGSVMLQARCLLGLMNAADHYGLEDLKLACIQFMEQCISIDTVCSLLNSAEKYIQYKSTKILVQKMFEFVDHNAEKILSLGAFQQLPQHVVRIVLGREELAATEVTKFNAAYRWALRYTEDHPETEIANVFEPFVDVINFARIPAKELMQNVRRAEVVQDKIILNALAVQADPSIVGESQPPHRLRKACTVPSEMDSRGPSPTSPSQHTPKIRRAQSTNQNQLHTDTNGMAAPPSNRWRGLSVPSLGILESKFSQPQAKVEVRPILSPDGREGGPRGSQVSSSSSSIPSQTGDSYHGSISSLGTDGERPHTPSSPPHPSPPSPSLSHTHPPPSSPLAAGCSRQPRPFLSFNTLDMIVSASNHDNRPVDV